MELISKIQVVLILVRITFFDDGMWHLAWFVPAMIYFICSGFCYLMIACGGIMFLIKQRIHEHLYQKTLSLIAISYGIEFGLLITVFFQSLILYTKYYTDPENFENLRNNTILILIIYLGVKFINLFLSLRYTD